MDNEGMTYKIEKKSLVETQLKQVKQLKTNLSEIKKLNLCEIEKLNLCFFPNSMEIKEYDDYFIFNFDEENKNNQGEKMNFVQLLGLQNQVYYEIVPYLIMRLLKLAINLSKFGIHLPMLNKEHFIQTQQPQEWREPDWQNSKQVQRIYLSKFGTEELSKQNKDLINNNNIPNEIIQKIVENNVQQIEFNEKMTVFSLGCIIYQIHTGHQVMENQDSQQLRESKKINIELADDDDSIKQLIENCIKKTPEDRPNLIQLQQEYLKIILRDKVLDLTKYKIYNLIPHIIDLKEQITGRLCIMEFLTKIKFIQLLFQKFGKIEKAQTENIMLFLINKEKEKLKLDQNKELTLWDEDNTRDEINEFKKNYLKLYNSTLELIADKIKKRNIQNKQFIELAIKLDDSLYNKKIQEILIQRNNLNDKSSQLNCLEHLNIIFKYRYLLDYFKPIREELITFPPDQRYDKILEILFSQNNNQEILDLSLIGKIKQKI